MRSDRKAPMGTGNPESLHQVGKGTDSKVGTAFLNPGTPESALMSMNDRKSGRAPGANEQMLREHAKGNNV